MGGHERRSDIYRKTDIASRFLLLIVGFLGTCSIAITTYGFNTVKEMNGLILKTSERIQELELRIVSIESSKFTYLDGINLMNKVSELDKKLSNLDQKLGTFLESHEK